MSRNVRVLRCTPEEVFQVLSDGWLYPSWVVGASRMREVDDDWPAPGAKLHHSVGTWPLLLNDETVVVEYEPPRRMVLRAKGWPVGEARAVIEVKPRGEGSVVRIQEEACAGPAVLVPAWLQDLALRPRNEETLKRLAYLAEGMAQRNPGTTTAEREMRGEPESDEEATADVDGDRDPDAIATADGEVDPNDGSDRASDGASG